MHVTGFTIVRNAVHYDYPIVESLRSALPLVDEMVVAVGNSCDSTREVVASLNDPKIRIVDTVWDDSQRSGGKVLAQQTNLAMQACEGDWLLYLQADEVLHEGDSDRIRAAMHRNLKRSHVDGLSFRYHHFRASFEIRDPLAYRRQIRIIRPGVGIRSCGDACGFDKQGRKPTSVSTGAWVYHYGFVKPPENLTSKMEYFKSLYNGQQVTPGEESCEHEYVLNLQSCEPFRGTHPAVMAERIANKSWDSPRVELMWRYRNPRFWSGLLHKNTRTFRRLLGTEPNPARKAA